jgi:3-hydroxyacyl-CoA dehydrogenase/enoyl-CoA hydratase/3-hydroxybutyryl-CoA epimerase
MDLQGFPLPPNCPEPGACIRVERPEEGLAVVYLDPPHRSLAVLDAPLLRDLDAVVKELQQETGLKGIVFAGAEPLKFAAGADVEGIGGITDPSDAFRIVQFVHTIFTNIENLKPTTVAAIGGPVPGGAYELSLSCNLIIAADDPKTRIGLPETQLGIIPGWGGSHRLPERIGVPLALDAIMTGRLMKAKVAKKRGMIDRITYPHRLVDMACEMAMGRLKIKRKKRGMAKWLVDRNPVTKAIIGNKVRKTVESKTRGKYPAPLRALDLVLGSGGKSRADASRLEAEAVADLAVGSICKSLVGIFFASEAAKKYARGNDDFRPRQFRSGAVIGGGVMGGAIASLAAEKGLAMRLIDLSRDALDAAQVDHLQTISKKRKRRRLAPHLADGAIDRLTVSEQMDGLKHADIVVEAVAERMDVKKAVLGQLAEKTPSGCLLATNTSSLSVTAMAEGISNPERVVGMHFFNPVRMMPLVEVVKGEQTSDAAAIEVAALAARMGKTPVVVKDVAGFLVNRLLGPYLDEAVRLFVAGANPESLDTLMLDFGMPMGPLRLLDEVGLDIASHAASSLHDAYGERMIPAAGVQMLAAEDRLGAKTGKGFYDHPKDRKNKPTLCVDLEKFQQEDGAKKLSPGEQSDRLILGMVNEAARCMEERVTATAGELDLATVFGMGFAPFHGGLLHYADSLGVKEVVRRLEAIAASPDIVARPGGVAKFTPAAYLLDLAERDVKIFD